MQNLQTFSSARDWDQIEAYASTISGALVYWENPRLELADADAKKIVLDYYKIDEDIPTDLAITLDGNYYGYIEFRNSDLAFDFVTDYFPRKDEVSDDTYWYHCYVIKPNGVIEYDNDALRKGQNV